MGCMKVMNIRFIIGIPKLYIMISDNMLLCITDALGIYQNGKRLRMLWVIEKVRYIFNETVGHTQATLTDNLYVSQYTQYILINDTIANRDIKNKKSI